MESVHHSPSAVRARIQQVLSLPALSPVAGQLLEVFSQEEVDIGQLVDVIKQDPGLTARLIGIANSAYFSERREICDLSQAIIRVLGLKLVRSLSLGIILNQPFQTDSCQNFALGRFWYIAMQTATLSTALSSQLQRYSGCSCCDRNGLFLGGLLHNLGLIIMVHVFPEEMTRVLNACSSVDDPDRHGLQQEMIGLDEIQAAIALARKWHLPDGIRDVLEYQHDPAYHGVNWPAVRLISYCAQLAAWAYDHKQDDVVDLHLSPALPLQLDSKSVEHALDSLWQNDKTVRHLANAMAQH